MFPVRYKLNLYVLLSKNACRRTMDNLYGTYNILLSQKFVVSGARVKEEICRYSSHYGDRLRTHHDMGYIVLRS
jgi:hypothetical protein